MTSRRSPFALAALAAMTVVVLAPLAQVVMVSLSDREDVLRAGADIWPPDFSAYVRAWTGAPFPRYFLNSVVVAGAVTLGSTFTAILAAYVFARADFPGRDALFMVVVATLMIPGHITLIPNYLTFAAVGALDSFAALIAPFLASGFSIFFLRQYMMGVPRSLDEAARLDGAGPWRILWTIVVPLSWPAIAAVALFAFLTEWNSFIWPLLATTSDEMRTAQVGLRWLFRQEAEGASVDWPLVMAGSMIVLTPMLAAFAVAERRLIEGIAMGGFR